MSLRDVRFAQMRAPLLCQQQRPENEESHETGEFDWSKSGDSEALSESKITENPEQQHTRGKKHRFLGEQNPDCTFKGQTIISPRQ